MDLQKVIQLRTKKMQTCAIKLYRHSLASKKSISLLRRSQPMVVIRHYTSTATMQKKANENSEINLLLNFLKCFVGGTVPTELCRQLNLTYHTKKYFYAICTKFYSHVILKLYILYKY